ncbi:MAG: ABC transporter permease [bacterium]
MNPLRAIKLIFLKETKDNVRDKRSLSSSLIMGPLLGPIIFAVMISFILKTEIEQAEKTLEIPTLGISHAPALVHFLESHDVLPQESSHDTAEQIKQGEIKLALSIPEDYAENLSSGKRATIELQFDSTNRKTGSKVRRVKNLLQNYSSQLASQRLLIRGINPEITRPLKIKEQDLAPPGAGAARMLSMLPYFVMMAVFMGGMHVAIDATAGERERNSLEPLLTLPTPRWQIMSGKLSTAALFSIISLSLNLLAFKVGLQFIPLEQLNMQLALTSSSYVQIFILMLPISLLAAALQTIIASHAKSFREAQTYVSFLMFVPMIPSIGLMVAPVDSAQWMSMVPILSQNILILDILRGESVALLDFILATLSSGLAALLLAVVAAKLYNQEKLAVSV